MIRFRIHELMEERGIKKPKLKLLIKAGISHGIAQKYLSGKKLDIRRTHIEIFCTILRCAPNDLFEYIPDTGTVPLDKKHPLYKIKPRQPFKIHDEISKLNNDELRKLFGKDSETEQEDEGK